ncbi:MAG: YbjN domain-containing protein [Nitrococcus sp.]|nr:YbjN domain-containing protein [Nitrococcus sp.]
MTEYFERVKQYVADLGYVIERELPEEQLIRISDDASGIQGLLIDCEDELLVLEQFILELARPDAATLTRLLQINRELVHGALALDEGGRRLIFRDTLQLENLDLNELEASIKSVSLMLAEHADEFIRIASTA